MQILPSKIKYFKEKWCFCMTWLKYLQIVDCNDIYVIHQVHKTNFWCVGFWGQKLRVEIFSTELLTLAK